MQADSFPTTQSFGWPARLPPALRVSLRLGALVPWTLISFLVFLAGKLPAALFHEGRRRWRHFAIRTWSRGLMSIFGMQARVSGPTPQAPFILVSNHLSYMDIPLLAAHLDCVFVAKAEIDSWPFVNWLCRSVDTIFVDRRNRKDVVRVNRLLAERVKEGSGLVFFPEATSTSGERVHPFKPSLLQPAVEAASPVHYCAISYRTPSHSPPASLSVCWWGTMGLPGHLLRILALPGFEAFLDFGEQPLSASHRKEMAKRLHKAVSLIFRTVRQPSFPQPSPPEEGS